MDHCKFIMDNVNNPVDPLILKIMGQTIFARLKKM